MRCFSKSGSNTISTRRRQEFFRNIMKAKVDQLNLVLVILKLVLAAGKLYMWVCVCMCVSSASFNRVCLYSLLLAVGSMFGFLWCLMLAFGKSQPLRALPCGMAFLSGCLGCPLMGGLSSVLEKPDIYNGLYLLGKKGGFIHRAERTYWRKVFH